MNLGLSRAFSRAHTVVSDFAAAILLLVTQPPVADAIAQIAGTAARRMAGA